jgi:hypothetical protein
MSDPYFEREIGLGYFEYAWHQTDARIETTR